jgi:WD40 repeat protein
VIAGEQNTNSYITYAGHKKWITDFTIEDDVLYTASADGTVMAWDASLEQVRWGLLTPLEPHTDARHSLFFCRNKIRPRSSHRAWRG